MADIERDLRRLAVKNRDVRKFAKRHPQAVQRLVSGGGGQEPSLALVVGVGLVVLIVGLGVAIGLGTLFVVCWLVSRPFVWVVRYRNWARRGEH